MRELPLPVGQWNAYLRIHRRHEPVLSMGSSCAPPTSRKAVVSPQISPPGPRRLAKD
jgi:hypothetical protein